MKKYIRKIILVYIPMIAFLLFVLGMIYGNVTLMQISLWSLMTTLIAGVVYK